MDIAIVVLVLGLIYWFLRRENNRLVTSRYYVPADVKDDLTIVQLSDIHSKRFGPNNEKLIAQIKPLDPDMIVITGDMVHKWADSVPAFVDSLSGLQKIAPVYAIPGNHEMRMDEWPVLRDMLRKAGIRVIENDVAIFSKNGQRVSILGLNESTDPDIDQLFARLNEIGGFRIVLSHFPLRFEEYQNQPFDLQLSGHAHGGQWRLPLIGGLYSPDQGLFPHYDAGLFEADGRVMVVSRGLGNSEFPLRLFNYPEVVCVNVTKRDSV